MRKLYATLTLIVGLAIYIFLLWAMLSTAVNEANPAIWNEYTMSDVKGH